MQVCNECGSIEQGTQEVTEDSETYEVCAICGFPAEECMVNYDEDYGVDR